MREHAAAARPGAPRHGVSAVGGAFEARAGRAAYGRSKSPRRELQAQHAAAPRRRRAPARDLARLDELLEVREVGAAAHVEVDPGADREHRGLAQVGRDPGR